MAGILGEYTELFLEESEDQIEELNANLLKLEADHKNLSIINDIFRAAHSLKSSAAFVGLYNLSDLAHKMENLLQLIRDGKLDVKLPLVNLLFQCFDLIKYVIANVSQGKKIDTPFMDMIQSWTPTKKILLPFRMSQLHLFLHNRLLYLNLLKLQVRRLLL